MSSHRSTSQQQRIRAREREKRAEDARSGWADYLRAGAEENAKTERLRAARLAHAAQQETRRNRKTAAARAKVVRGTKPPQTRAIKSVKKSDAA